MPIVKLDAAFCLIASCPPEKKKETYWDTITTGFTLDVRKGGGKTYSLRYLDQNQRQRQLKIGRHEDITFDQARKAAKRLRSQVVLGGDPAGQKEAKRAVPKYATLAQQHLDHVATYVRRPDAVESVMRNHLLPRWGDLRLDEIKQQDISKWLAEKRAAGLAPATVEKMRVTLNRSFRLAKQWGIPGAETNPVDGVPRPRFNNAKERFLTSGDVTRLLEVCERSSSPQLAAIVKLLLYTGARKNELLKAEWSNVDLDRRAWFIPDSKTGQARYVPLSQPAVEVLEKLVRIPGCPYVVPNPATGRPYTDMKRVWDRVRSEAGLGDFRIHDLRHSAASFMINAGVDLFTVGRVLGHADHQSTMRYSHLANETLMAAVEAGAAKLKDMGR